MHDPSIPLLILVLVAGFLLWNTFFITKQQTNKIVERFGRFKYVAKPGLRLKIPFVDRVVATISLRVLQLDVEIETKTTDDVFVKIPTSVQYKVMEGKTYDAYYRLESPERQIRAYIYDVIRSEVPKRSLDKVFEQKDELSQSIKLALDAKMQEYGWDIEMALITDIEPAAVVKEAMNRKEAAKRLREAAENEGEAERIRLVKVAEGEKQSKHLQGEGIAEQRKAIAQGISDSVRLLHDATGIGGNEVLAQLLITQHYDTIEAVGRHGGNAKVILMPMNPGTVGNLMTELTQAMMAAREATELDKDQGQG